MILTEELLAIGADELNKIMPDEKTYPRVEDVLKRVYEVMLEANQKTAIAKYWAQNEESPPEHLGL